MPSDAAGGPLTGVRVIELAGIGPGPFAAMMLADLGADVVRVDRADTVQPALFGLPHPDVLNRGRRSIAVDLKTPAGRQVVLDLVRDAHVLLEGFRPGVTERLGLGPDDCLAVNPSLVYGRMTGWGQDGPLAQYAGHDINYLSLTGALHAIGRAGERPVPPLNLLGDFGGGGLMLAFGVVCALLHVRSGVADGSRVADGSQVADGGQDGTGVGRGQVVDAAIVDGVATLSTAIYGLRNLGMWRDERGVNLLDGGAPFYDTYRCADGRFLAVGALEPKFYAELSRLAGFPAGDNTARLDPHTWPEQRERLTALFATRSRDEWAALLERSDACTTPVLDWSEAPAHPHLAARGVFVEQAGVSQPAPAPRFSVTPGALHRPAPQPGEHTDEVLAGLGRTAEQIAALRADHTVA